MFKKIILTLLFFFWASISFAHQGRIDSSGGHRVNKKWQYEGRYIVIKDKIKYYQTGKILFEEGDYHFHCKPELNNFKDGIYIPVNDNKVKDISTSEIILLEDSIVASNNSNLYHKANCPYVKNIKEDNAVIFKDMDDAEDSGYMAHSCIKEGGD